MNNRDLDAGWAYHNATKHSYASVRSGAHFLDWANQPLPFKIYPHLEAIPLPREAPQTGVAALAAIAETGSGRPNAAALDLQTLSLLLYFSAGITRQRKYPGGEIYFRAAACTGALYEIELYPVVRTLPDLDAGVYHFSPADFSLRQLRAGHWRGTLAEATGNEPAVAQAPLILVCTGTYWRNAWKYQARTYRHFGWDNGTLLANLLAMAAALGLRARVICGFVDAQVNRLLGVDEKREVAFSLVAIGEDHAPPAAPASAPQLTYEVLPASRREVDYPAMREVHAASSLTTPEEVAAWRGQLPAIEPARRTGALFQLRPLNDDAMPRDPIERVILRRGSTRRFARAPITQEQLATLLDRSTRAIPADFLEPGGRMLNELYLIVHAVEGVAAGAYYLRRETLELELLKEGSFREEAAFLGLEQELPGDASVAVFFLADLKRIFERFGNRGYRAAQLEAGILGGKLYLAAYALGLGATGLTFYDDEVVRFFSPHAAGKSAVFLTAIGQKPKREKAADTQSASA
ncbi:MAG TPA: SagB/ThcOx family dehydrogenase [Terriglobales bacterium]|nr:SagB/ThcOx family dehydrogenase [Terriglobales bacterium]